MTWYDRLRYLVSSDAFAVRSTLVRKVLEGDAEMKLATLAVALARHHLAHERYPPTLDELIPGFIPALPVDRVSGQRFGYRALPDGGFLLYSAGRDGVDDGGDASPAEGKEKLGSIWDGRDAVWPRLATNGVMR